MTRLIWQIQFFVELYVLDSIEFRQLIHRLEKLENHDFFIHSTFKFTSHLSRLKSVITKSSEEFSNV